MPIFTAIGAAIFGAGTFLASATATVLSVAASVGLSYAAQALSGKNSAPAAQQQAAGFAVSGKLQAAGDLARSFMFGSGMTAGSLVYANTWGDANKTPNAYLVQVIALSDLPVSGLAQVFVNGDAVTLGTADPTLGYAVTQYNTGGADHLWVKFYDGTQTGADSYLVGKFAADANRPYASTRIGYGVAYAVVTALVNDQLFSGFPTFKFVLNGVKLYDPSKDSTNGGSGSHRWSDQTTWGGDGDQFPAVQIYNLLRGVTYNSGWLYGLQNTNSNRLPNANWIAQINKCRDTITGTSGLEPTYRTGGEITVSSPIADCIQALLTGCQGRLIEIGGFYKARLGAPDSPVWSFTDDAIISTAEQSFVPFFGLADTINGIAGTYPSPAQAYNTTAAPTLYRSDLETQDGNRRLMANVAFNLVPYDAQVQRLMKSALDEARRARRHTLVLPPDAWLIEPGDVISWTSVRNGYSTKSFRVDGAIDQEELDVTLDITEVDPADYSWNHAIDFQTPVDGPIVRLTPPAQPIIDWFATGSVIIDANGIERRPAIQLSWDGAQPDVSGVAFEVRNGFGSNDVVYRSRTDNAAAGSILVSQGLLSNTHYQVRGQYIPGSPRATLWSGWLDVTTPDTRLSLYDVDAAIKAQVTQVTDYLNDQLTAISNQIAAIAMNQDSRNWLDKKSVRSDLNSTTGTLNASISDVRTVATDTQAAFASYQVTVNASIADINATVTTTATALANTQTAFASYQTTVNASIGSLNSSVTTNASAIANIDGRLAASYSVTLDTNGYATGFQLLNGGTGISAFVVTADKFQIASPSSVAGGAAVPIFTVANVNGTPKIAFRADMYADGTIAATKILAGSIDSTRIAVGGVDINNLIAGAATNITSAKLPNIVHYGDNLEHTLLSLPVTSAGGTLQVIAIAGGHDDVSSITQSGMSFQASPVTSSTYRLYIDGVLFDFQSDIRPLVTSVLSPPSTIQYPTVARINATMIVGIPLSPGVHTVALTVQMVQGAAVSGGANGITFDRGAIIAFESRR